MQIQSQSTVNVAYYVTQAVISAYGVLVLLSFSMRDALGEVNGVIGYDDPSQSFDSIAPLLVGDIEIEVFELVNACSEFKCCEKQKHVRTQICQRNILYTPVSTNVHSPKTRPIKIHQK